MKTLETNRMILRNWELSDLDDFAEMWTNPNVTVPQGDSPKLSKDECLPLLVFLLNAKNNYALEIKETGKVIGSVGLNEDSDNNPNGRNLGYILNEDYWNKGFMQEALIEIANNAHEITSFLSVGFTLDNENHKSQHIARKLGFRFLKTIKGGLSKINGEELADIRYYILELKSD
jgi:RimJ/RimL family protein N-acetyltransferase